MFIAILWLYVICPTAPICAAPVADSWGPYASKELCEERIEKFRGVDASFIGVLGADGLCIQSEDGITA